MNELNHTHMHVHESDLISGEKGNRVVSYVLRSVKRLCRNDTVRLFTSKHELTHTKRKQIIPESNLSANV